LKTTALLDFFKVLKKIFDENNIECWLIYGALLGMVREGKLLEWDNDIDIAIWDTSLGDVELVVSEFNDKGITVHFTESGHVSFNYNNQHISAMVYSIEDDKAVRYTFTNMRKFKKTADGVKHLKGLDKTTQLLKYIRWLSMKPYYVGNSPQFISEDLQKTLIHAFYLMPNRLRLFLKRTVEIILSSGCKYFTEEVPAKFFLDLSTIPFYDFTVKVPSDKEGYLEYKYGADWMVPKRDYIYYKDSKSEVAV